MNYKELAKVADSATKTVTVSEESKKKIIDALRTKKMNQKRKKVIDALHTKKRNQKRKQVIDALRSKRDKVNYKTFRVSDSYKALLKKIKDDLENTESTEEAIGTVLSEITPEQPAEQVLSAVVEVLGETIDQLSEQLETKDVVEGDPGEPSVE